MTPKQLVAVAEAVLLNPAVSALREYFPRVGFSECSEKDIPLGRAPALVVDGHNLYLFAGTTGNGQELTDDLETATGIVVARRIDEDRGDGGALG